MVAPMTMPEPWWSCCCLPGRQRKSGSSDRATFMRKVPEPDLRLLKRAASSGSTAPSGTRSRNSSFGGTLAATVRAAMRSPDASRTPAILPSSMMRPATGASQADAGAARLRRVRHGPGDGAHAADGMAPHAALAVDLAEAVVQQHVGRARRMRAGVGADDAVEGERALEHVALEPLIEEVGCALGEEIEQQALVGERKTHEPPAEARAADQLEDAAADVGRCLEGERAQEATRRARARRRRPAAARHPWPRTPPPRAAVGNHAVGHQQRAPLVHRPEVGDGPLDDLQAMPRELEIGDHDGVQQAHRVGGDRVAEARMELLGDGRPADHRVLFEHDDAQAGARQIGSAGEAVVPAADDGDVVGIVGHVPYVG